MTINKATFPLVYLKILYALYKVKFSLNYKCVETHDTKAANRLQLTTLVRVNIAIIILKTLKSNFYSNR